MNAHTQIKTDASKTPEAIIYDAVLAEWELTHIAPLPFEKVADAFKALWLIAGIDQGDFGLDFCKAIGGFSYEFGPSYTYGDHPDVGGGVELQDIEGCTFEPTHMTRADITRILGPDALDTLDDYGMEASEWFLTD